MQELAYRSWALISVDADPAGTEATVTAAPVIVNVAIESGASLVFELAESFAKLSITPDNVDPSLAITMKISPADPSSYMPTVRYPS